MSRASSRVTDSPVVKIELKRADVHALIQGDPTLSECAFVKALGSWGEHIWGTGLARRYPAGAVVFQQGDESDALVFVLHGQLRLSGRNGPDSVDLGLIGPGEVAGQTEAVDGGARHCTLVAVEQADVVELPRVVVAGLVVRSPAVRALLESLDQRQRAELDEMTDFLNRW